MLTSRELNRAVLARQLLLDRVDRSLPKVLEAMGGLQAQYAPSMYVGLWSRVAGFARADLTGALERREVVQATLLRSTIHLVSAADYWPWALGIRQARRDWFLRVARPKVTTDELARAADRLREVLADGPRSRADLDTLVDKPLRNGVGLWVELVRVPPSGTWERRRADLFGLAEHWLGPPACTPEEGIELLVRRYLGAFGPAARADVANWAGVPVGVVAPALDRLPLRRFRAEDGTDLLDLPRAPLPDAGTPAPVRYLPTWDATLLVHARRAGILPEEHRPKIFHIRNPQSTPTFLVDGAVAGTWRHRDGRVVIEEFAPLPASVRRELAEEGDRLAALHA